MGFLDNLEAWLDFGEDIDKDPEMEVEKSEAGYSTGKWSDDDYTGNITPFFGKDR